ncbi:MAG: hypothetical protein O2890_02975 [Cyanobacteria bacterium]|nr:hypothetical protein [Cyanobacteriota bacterium]MDA0865378.1 hypothetical protein [Cyanobacteriota bacterium]
MDQEAYLLHLSRYIHLNPVKAGLVDRAEDWEFSSYQDYVALRQGKLPQFDSVREQVGTAQEYQTFVEADQLMQTGLQQLMLDE